MLVYSPPDPTPAEAPTPPPPTVGQHTLSELLSYVREAEQKLASFDLEEQIHGLRGIYYGTPWSLDYHQNNSDMRNFGFQAYSHSGMPPDIRPALGTTLFNNLYECAEFKLTPSISLDFGHVMMGLDARAHYLARSWPHPVSLFGGTGLDVCTWLGDLGGATGQLSFLRLTLPDRRATSEFQGSNFGGIVNLEGDIAAYLVGAPTGPLSDAPAQPDSGLLSDYLDAYCQVGGAVWQARVGRFLQVMGAKISGTTIVNLEDFRRRVALSCQRFGEAYLYFRLKGKPQPDKMFIEASRNLVGASQEVASIFVDLMARSLLAPAGALAAPTLDPNPTPPGAPFKRYQNAHRGIQGAERLRKEATDWLRQWRL